MHGCIGFIYVESYASTLSANTWVDPIRPAHGPSAAPEYYRQVSGERVHCVPQHETYRPGTMFVSGHSHRTACSHRNFKAAWHCSRGRVLAADFMLHETLQREHAGVTWHLK